MTRRTIAPKPEMKATPTAPATKDEPAPAAERVYPLRVAEQLITKDRNNTYGPPDADFQRIAGLWSVMFDRTFTAHEVALAMICLKLSRLTWSPGHVDNWVDVVGYAGCGHECAVLEEKRRIKEATP